MTEEMTEEQHEQQREDQQQEDPDQLGVDDGMGEAEEDQQPETFPSDSVEEDGGTDGGNVKSSLSVFWRLTVAIGVIFGILIGIIQLYYWLADPSPKIGTAATSGPLSITPKSVDCGRTAKDIPKTVREIIPDDAEGTLEQICFVPTHIRNDSDVQLRGALQPKGLSRYELSASAGSLPPPRPKVYQGVRFRDVSDFHDSDLGRRRALP
jgi:hypothetical protein